jgi:hypothetical protein
MEALGKQRLDDLQTDYEELQKAHQTLKTRLDKVRAHVLSRTAATPERYAAPYSRGGGDAEPCHGGSEQADEDSRGRAGSGDSARCGARGDCTTCTDLLGVEQYNRAHWILSWE